VLGRAPTVCLCLAIALIAAPASAVEQPFAKMTTRVLDGYVIPHFARLEQASAKLAGDLTAACAPQPVRLAAARSDFREAVLAWAAVEFLRFGPMSVTGRPERFAFWPDPRGVTQRQLRALIARRDPSALDALNLKEKSAAVQGLTALEALLTDAKHPLDSNDEEGRYRCRLAVAMAQALAATARDILSDWGGAQGWRQRMLTPGAQNESYKSEAEPPAELARALITGLQMLQDRQVAPLIAAQAKPGKSARLPFARSQLAAPYAASAVESLRELYEALGLAANVPRKKAWMTEWITTAFKRLAHDAPAALEAETGTGKDPERARKLRFLRFHMEGIRKLVGRELAPLAGLTIGFNELDGD